jgi:colanic acid biosynthesis glycosyl transferase WcaI
MLAKLEDRTSTGSFFFPNWLDPDFIDPTAASVHPILSEDHFQVLYSGNIGEKQDWKAFVNLVTEFADDKGIEFVVVGDGASRKALEKKINHLRNVRFCDPVPQSQLNDLLCSADLHILLQKDNVIDTVMPSKLLGMMASEVPCLVSGHPKSEVSEIFKKHECGIYLESSDLKSTVSIIKELMAFGPQNQAMGKNARKFVIDSFSSEKVLERFRIKLDSIYES